MILYYNFIKRIQKAKIRSAGNTGGVTGCSGDYSTAGITLSRNTGSINYVYTAQDPVHSIGGIVGAFQYGNVVGCTNYATIKFITSESFVAGVKTNIGLIVGRMISSNVTTVTCRDNVYTYATIDAGALSDKSHVGGEIGYNDTQIGTVDNFLTDKSKIKCDGSM